MGIARTLNVAKEWELEPFTVPRGALGVFGGAISGALTAVSRNGTIGSDA